MKTVKRVLFVLLWMLIGFIVGAWISSLFISETDGFGGVGAVFVSGISGAVIGLILSLILIFKTSEKNVSQASWLGIFVFAVLTITLAVKNSSKPSQSTPEPQIPTKPINYLPTRQPRPMGIGMASPLQEKGTVYFYNPNLKKQVDEHLPYDSLTFQRTENGIEISYAPPWFFPVHMKMDYGILFLKVESITKDWIQLEVNQQTGRKAWMSRSDVDFQSWENFLLSIHSIESLDPASNPVRTRPLLHSAPLQIQGTLYVPREITSEWVKVEVYTNDYESVGEGWIKWREGNRLLVSYNLLS